MNEYDLLNVGYAAMIKAVILQ